VDIVLVVDEVTQHRIIHIVLGGTPIIPQLLGTGRLVELLPTTAREHTKTGKEKQ
jgi:hypothetical protein